MGAREGARRPGAQVSGAGGVEELGAVRGGNVGEVGASVMGEAARREC